jgi:hypothetical protein
MPPKWENGGEKMAGGRWREKAETNPELSVADFREQL